uniref:Secreted protein n=1 Tax=Arundo donax TaxID=35708 RepID=A0A0A9H6C3_ARUDO
MLLFLLWCSTTASIWAGPSFHSRSSMVIVADAAPPNVTSLKKSTKSSGAMSLVAVAPKLIQGGHLTAKGGAQPPP